MRDDFFFISGLSPNLPFFKKKKTQNLCMRIYGSRHRVVSRLRSYQRNVWFHFCSSQRDLLCVMTEEM